MIFPPKVGHCNPWRCGGNAATWTEEKKAKRLAGLKQALETGKAILEKGGTSLDAVEATIRVLEDDPAFNAGRGAVVTADGRAELDASIMDGKHTLAEAWLLSPTSKIRFHLLDW